MIRTKAVHCLQKYSCVHNSRGLIWIDFSVWVNSQIDYFDIFCIANSVIFQTQYYCIKNVCMYCSVKPRVQNTQEGHYYDYVIHVNYAYLWCKKSKTSNFKEDSDIG